MPLWGTTAVPWRDLKEELAGLTFEIDYTGIHDLLDQFVLHATGSCYKTPTLLRKRLRPIALLGQ